MRNRFFWMIVAVGVAIVFCLSWLPQPRLSSYWFMPHWLGRWTDATGHENMRTAVPFVFIGGFTGMWLARLNKPFRHWVVAFALMILVATIAELGQLLLPQRSCDVGDILWGAAGSFIGLAFAAGVGFVYALFSRQSKPGAVKKMSPQYGI